MSNLCIIPARGGSKGIPGKNIALVAGKPLIAWSIEQAIAADCVERVIVSTDSEQIAEIARAHGAEVPFLRPAALATDIAPTEPALLHTIDQLQKSEGYVPDFVVLLQATSPIRKQGALDRAFARLTAQKGDSLLSVREIHPFLWRNEAAPVATYDFNNRPRRQDIAAADHMFEETGSIYITRTSFLRQTKNRLGGKIVIFPMDSQESWDIDTPSDLVVAAALLDGMRNQ